MGMFTNFGSKVDKLTSNATFVALVTTALASFLIPLFTSRRDNEKHLRAERAKLAMEFIEHNTETQRDLNALFTTLALFDKDNSSGLLGSNEYKELQRNARKQMDAQYQKFNEKAWWWYWDLTTDASEPGVASAAELTQMQNLDSEYGKNLAQTMTCIDELWAALLRKNYRPNDPKTAALIQQTDKRLQVLSNKRNQMAMAYVQLFENR